MWQKILLVILLICIILSFVPANQPENNFLDNNKYLLIASAIVIFFVIYLFKPKNSKIKYNQQIYSDQPQTSPQKALEIDKNPINDFSVYLTELQNRTDKNMQGEEHKLLINNLENMYFMIQNLSRNNIDEAEKRLENVKEVTNQLISNFEKMRTNTIISANIEIPQTKEIENISNELQLELEKQKIQVNHKKQYIDVLILEFLLEIAEDKIHHNDFKAAKSLISATEILLKNDLIMQRLRKLREIGF